jgi:hypothetical protein
VLLARLVERRRHEGKLPFFAYLEQMPLYVKAWFSLSRRSL